MSVNINASNETFITNNAPNNNYGGVPYMLSGTLRTLISYPLYTRGGNQIICLLFDLSSIPATSTINSATLHTHLGVMANGYMAATYRVRQINGTAWTESGLTYNNCPSIAGTDLATISYGENGIPSGWGTWTSTASMLTALASALAGGKIAIALITDQLDDTNGIAVTGKRYDNSLRPYLTVDYTNVRIPSLNALQTAKGSAGLQYGSGQTGLSDSFLINAANSSISGFQAPIFSDECVYTLTLGPGPKRAAISGGSLKAMWSIVEGAGWGNVIASSNSSCTIYWSGPNLGPCHVRCSWDDGFNTVMVIDYPVTLYSA